MVLGPIYQDWWCSNVIATDMLGHSKAILKVTDFTISMYGSSCNAHLLSFFLDLQYFLASHPALWMPINRKTKRMSENEEENEIIT